MKINQITQNTALMSALLVVSLANNAFGATIAGVDPKNTVTASMDGGTAKTGNTWYELGVNSAAATTGLRTGLLAGQTDPLSIYQIRPAAGFNALVLDNATKLGTLTFTQPLTLNAISLAAASGNGAGTVTPTLYFTDGTADTLASLTVGDWFGQTPRVETTAGRVNLNDATFNNVNADNPRLLAINATLSAADQAKAIFAIDLAWTGGATTHTAVFALSGDTTGIGHFTAIPLTGGSFNEDIIVGLSEIPEPNTVVLFAFGALGLLAIARRNRS